MTAKKNSSSKSKTSLRASRPARSAGSANAFLLTYAPLLASLVVLACMLWQARSSIAYYTGGHFTYALDDAYIHMAISKNLATHGVWGATRFEFTAASSSLLWTLLLAASFAIGGVREVTPLVLTTLSAAGALVVADVVMRKLEVRVVVRAFALGFLVLGVPMIPIVFGGMEHPLQILIDIAFVYLASRLIAREDFVWDSLTFGTLALAAAATAVRFEGAVIVAIVAVLLAVRRRWVAGVSVAAAGAAPIVAFGVYSIANGGYFLPNSVLVKSTQSLADVLLHSGPVAWAAAFGAQAQTAYPVYALMIVVGALFALGAGRPLWDARTLFPLIVLTTAGIHLLVGQVGWFYRYEAYLIALLAVGVAVQMGRVVTDRSAFSGASAANAYVAVALTVVALGAGIYRGWGAFEATPRASENVYEQMYQTAHFLKDNPQYTSVAIGDLGAVAFYNDDLRILDLEGLAERGVPLSHLGRGRETQADIARLAKENGVQLAIVFPDYFDLPSDWTEVARWKIANNITAYADTVAFFAVPPTDPDQLTQTVRGYSLEKLPKTVGAEGRPTGQ